MVQDAALASPSLALATGATLLLLSWSALGRRGGSAAVDHLLKRRFIAASAALVPLVGLTALAPWLADRAHAAAVGVLAAAALLLREALDPLRPGPWHHKRLRPLALACGFCGGALLGFTLPRPELVPLLVAVVVYHRHVGGAQILFAQSLSEIEALARKVQALDAALRLEQAMLVEAETDDEPVEVAAGGRP